jgi:peptidoglycan/xylan/chitin deacetylase (PgdA/CDA1 family)
MHWKFKAGASALALAWAAFALHAEDIPIPPHQTEETPSASLAGYPNLATPAPATNTIPVPGGSLAYPLPEQTNAQSAKSAGAGMALHPGTAGPGRTRPALWNSVNTKRKIVALTFDDGPHGKLTPRLLDLLRRENVRATFFVLGSLVAANPQIVQRMAAEGHEVANHTWDHPRLPSLSPEKFDEQIRKTTEIIEQNTGKKVTIMRPTYGLYNERVKNELLSTYGLDIILWSVDPNDWKKPGAKAVARRLADGAHPGAILLAHDIHPGTIAAMPQAIVDLKATGYEFATVSELLAMDEAETPETTPAPDRGAASEDPLKAMATAPDTDRAQ